MGKSIAIFAGHYADLWEEKHSKGRYTNLEPDGVYEEFDTNIVIAREAVKFLRTVKGLTVYFPQEHGADYRSLKDRVDFCNEHKVDTAIFIHSNAGSPSAHGACAFFFEGSAPGERMANYYRDEMKKAGYPLWSNGTYGCNPRDNWSWFYVVVHTTMPVILTENFFFTNDEELKAYLQDKQDLKKLGYIQAKAGCRYLGLDLPSNAPVVSKTQEIKGKSFVVTYDKPNDGVNFYTKPDWNAKPHAQFKKGVTHEIVGKLNVDGHPMYKFINDDGKAYYITASDAFVKTENTPKKQEVPNKMEKNIFIVNKRVDIKDKAVIRNEGAIVFRQTAEEHEINAEENIYICGGGKKGLKLGHGKVVDLSGDTAEKTGNKVDKYFNLI